MCDGHGTCDNDRITTLGKTLSGHDFTIASRPGVSVRRTHLVRW